jgi:excisionase family DNA binding protein
MTIDTAPDPMTVAEVAELMRIGKSTVLDLCNAGIVRHQRIGTGPRGRIIIFKTDLIAWIDASKTGGRSS